MQSLPITSTQRPRLKLQLLMGLGMVALFLVMAIPVLHRDANLVPGVFCSQSAETEEIRAAYPLTALAVLTPSNLSSTLFVQGRPGKDAFFAERSGSKYSRVCLIRFDKGEGGTRSIPLTGNGGSSTIHVEVWSEGEDVSAWLERASKKRTIRGRKGARLAKVPAAELITSLKRERYLLNLPKVFAHPVRQLVVANTTETMLDLQLDSPLMKPSEKAQTIEGYATRKITIPDAFDILRFSSPQGSPFVAWGETNGLDERTISLQVQSSYPIQGESFLSPAISPAGTTSVLQVANLSENVAEFSVLAYTQAGDVSLLPSSACSGNQSVHQKLVVSPFSSVDCLIRGKNTARSEIASLVVTPSDSSNPYISRLVVSRFPKNSRRREVAIMNATAASSLEGQKEFVLIPRLSRQYSLTLANPTPHTRSVEIQVTLRSGQEEVQRIELAPNSTRIFGRLTRWVRVVLPAGVVSNVLQTAPYLAVHHSISEEGGAGGENAPHLNPGPSPSADATLTPVLPSIPSTSVPVETPQPTVTSRTPSVVPPDPTSTATSRPTPSVTATPIATVLATATSRSTPSVTATPMATVLATATATLIVPPTRTPTPVPTLTATSTPSSPIISGIEQGMAWLRTSSTYSLGWSGKRYESVVLPANLQLASVDEQIISRAPNPTEVVQVRQWASFPAKPCKLAVAVEDQGGTSKRSVYLSRCGTYNSFGVRNCPNPELSFLGQRQIRNFEGAFGVAMFCRGTAVNNRNLPYESRIVAWYHPKSNHPDKLVQLSKYQYVNYGTNQRDHRWWTESYSNYRSPHPRMQEILYTGVDYQLSGNGVARPGWYHEPVYCPVNSNTLTTDAIVGADFFIFKSSSGNFDLVEGYWDSNAPYRPGVYTSPFSNGNPLNRNVIISGGVPSITINKIGTSDYYRVRLNSGLKTVDHRFASAIVSPAPEFNCYGLPSGAYPMEVVGAQYYSFHDY